MSPENVTHWQPYIVKGAEHPGVKIRWKNDEHSELEAMLEPNGHTNPHTHSGVESICILEGEGELTLADVQQVLQEGQEAEIPANTIHTLRNTSASKILRVIATFSPAFPLQNTELIENKKAI